MVLRTDISQGMRNTDQRAIRGLADPIGEESALLNLYPKFIPLGTEGCQGVWTADPPVIKERLNLDMLARHGLWKVTASGRS
jgi:hypothetical protein